MTKSIHNHPLNTKVQTNVFDGPMLLLHKLSEPLSHQSPTFGLFLACLNHKQAKNIMVETTVNLGHKNVSTIVQAQMFGKLVFTFVPNFPWKFLFGCLNHHQNRKMVKTTVKLCCHKRVWNKNVFTIIQTLRFGQMFWLPNVVNRHNKA